MTGETNLSVLLKTMQPSLHGGTFVFCTTKAPFRELLDLEPICLFEESEGRTLIVPQERADAADLAYETVFRMITLDVHSSLEAVGFLAAIATRLARHGISANTVSACYHDHLFIPDDRADEAWQILTDLAQEAAAKPGESTS